MTERTLVIIPTYNERENLVDLIERLLEVSSVIEVLVVDDASPDGTAALAEQLASRSWRIHLLQRSAKLGMGTAYVEGFRWARRRGFCQVAQVDADGSHDPASLQGLIKALDEADLVIGSRAVAGGGVVGWGPHRLALSRAGSAYCRLLLGWSLDDPTSGFRALGPRALEVVTDGPVRAEGFAFQIEVAYRALHAGLTVAERPIIFTDRLAGQSKLSASIVAEALAVVPLLRLCSAVGAFDRSRTEGASDP